MAADPHGRRRKESRVFRPWIMPITLVFRVLLGGVFVYASMGKILDPAAFSEAIINYRAFTTLFVNLAALWLPWIELTAGICLVSGIWLGGSALAVAVLNAVFVILTGQAIARGLDISCGCFSLGGDQKSVQWTHVLQNILMLAMAVQVMLAQGEAAEPGKG